MLLSADVEYYGWNAHIFMYAIPAKGDVGISIELGGASGVNALYSVKK